MPEGIILKGVGGLYSVKCDAGVYFCRARGLFRKSGQKPLPGDRVEFTITDEADKEGYLKSIYTRKNSLVRPAVANVDLAFIIVSSSDPEPDLMLADKLLCIFEGKGIESVLCINKADLTDSGEIENIAGQFLPAGYEVLVTDAKSGMGIEQIQRDITGKVCIFAGQSGVGKSTILNQLIGTEIMETGGISKKIGRGRHTTRHAQFVEAFGGYIVDTPGFSSLDAGLLVPDDIKNLYREFPSLSDKCRFNGCMHINEPDCAVKEAAGEGMISQSRHERYVKIYTQAKEAEIKRRGY
ncbi:MAG: ribosome small subunit-dependent GTPase A [Clostridia bacterium]|nr:ribosome small subunit-dependent GTPase A [Clostridia bacterium]